MAESPSPDSTSPDSTSPDSMSLDGMDLEQVGLDVLDPAPLWTLFVGDLGGQWAGTGADGPGRSWGRIRFARGMNVEATTGVGPGHVAFRVSDLREARDHLESAGLPVSAHTQEGRPLGYVRVLATNIVGLDLRIQGGVQKPAGPPPHGLPSPRVANPAELVQVALAVADLEASVALFKILGGRTENAGAGGGLGWVDLAWPGSRRLRLLAGDPIAEWLGRRAGGLHHLGFSVENPADMAGAVGYDGWWESSAELPGGIRVMVAAPGDSFPLLA